MGRGSSKAGGGGGGGAQQQAQATQTVQTLAGGGGATVFGQFTNQDAQQLRDDVDDLYDPDVTAAIKLYISDSNPNRDGYSHSQNLNYKLDNGLPLNTNEKYIDDNIQAGMHDIGKDVQLTRYCHDDILQQCGISNYARLSESQLKSQLVGTEIQTTSYLSTSYDASKSPFAPNQPLGGGREVIMHVNAHANTQMVFGARKQTEIIINKNTKMRITDIRYDGSTAYPRNSGAKPRVEIFVETYSD